MLLIASLIAGLRLLSPILSRPSALHVGLVVTETRTWQITQCCQEDDQCQWGMAKFIPSFAPKPFDRSSPEVAYVITSRIPVILQNFIQISSGVAFPHPKLTRLRSFLADVNSRSRSLLAVAIPSVVCLSSVCNVGAPYSGG